MNTGFLRLCIYTFRYFEKEKHKINSLKISSFQCEKPTYSAKRLYLLRSLFWLCQSDILAVAKVIFRLTPKLRRLSITFPRHTLLFWNRIIASGNAHSYACLRLFLHASTKVSCVGFIIRCPFREIATALQATSRNDIKCFARNGISDVAYSTLSVIEQSNAATNPYFVRNSRMIMKKIIYWHCTREVV